MDMLDPEILRIWLVAKPALVPLATRCTSNKLSPASRPLPLPYDLLPLGGRHCHRHRHRHNNPAAQSKCRWQSKKEEKCQRQWLGCKGGAGGAADAAVAQAPTPQPHRPTISRPSKALSHSRCWGRNSSKLIFSMLLALTTGTVSWKTLRRRSIPFHPPPPPFGAPAILAFGA